MALHQSKVNDRFQEPIFIVLELLRAGVLHGQRLGGEYRSGGPSGAEEHQASNMLIMRCLSILPLNFRVRLSDSTLHYDISLHSAFHPLGSHWPALHSRSYS